MKTYDARKRRSKQLKKAIKNTLAYHEKFKSAYFWTPPGGASGRRSGEKQFKINNPEYKILAVVDKVEVEIEVIPSLQYSCKNVYYSLDIYMSEKSVGLHEKYDVRLLKKIIK